MKQFAVDYRQDDATRRLDVNSSGDMVAEVRNRLDTFGFAIARIGWTNDATDALNALAGWLHLGSPMVPEMYRLPGAEKFNSALAHVRKNADGGNHPSFNLRSAQALHVDGVIDEFSSIPMTLLYCVRPAASGGRTILFNSLAAFNDLARRDPEAARTMRHPNVLRRMSTIPGISADRLGPAFRLHPDGTISTRYSDGATEQWTAPAGMKEAFTRAIEFFRTAGETDNRYRTSVLLQAGECLVFRNDRLSHGRESYEDDERSPRHLVRALYSRVPA